MSTDRWERVEALFSKAVSLDPRHRAFFLDEACRDDVSLRAEVDELLEAHDVADGPLDRPLFESRQSEPALNNDQIIDGRFRICRFVGRGGMGEVYEAEDLDLGVTVALKTLLPEHLADPHLQARFRREIHLARRVTHANVCRVFDLGKHVSEGHETNFLTMQFLDGVTLAEYLRSHGRLSPDEVLALVRQMAHGLAALAEAGIVHRDFKPGNIMLTPVEGGSRAVIMDFGLARAVATEDRNTILSTAGLVMGTPAYMAPEQLLGEKVGPFSDVYALAVVTYELITGAAPFRGNTAIRIMLRKLTEAPPAPTTVVPDLDGWWDEFVFRCMERDVQQRVQSPQQVLQWLDEYEARRSRPGAESAPPTQPVALPEQSGSAAERKSEIGANWRRVDTAKPGDIPGGAFAGQPVKTQALAKAEGPIQAVRSVPAGASHPADDSWPRVTRWPKWIAAGVIAAGLAVLGAWQIPSVRTPIQESACGVWPGSSMFCLLPADKDLAVLPFQIEGAADEDRVLARGVAQHLADLSARLYPHRADFCLHFRRTPEEIYSEKLSAKWTVAVAGESATVSMEVRRTHDGQLVRTLSRQVALDNLNSVNEAFRSAISTLGENVPPDAIEVWGVPETSRPGAAISYFRGRGYLEGPGYLSDPPPADGWKLAQTHLVQATSQGGYDFAPAMVSLGNAYQQGCLSTGTSRLCESANNAYVQAQATTGFAPLYAGWGKLQLASGESAKGIANLRQALEMDPFDLPTRQVLAGALEAEDHGDEAEQVWLDGIHAEGECWLYNNALSLLYLNSGKYEDSEKQMLRSIELTPGHVAAYGNLALIYIMQGRYSDAIAAATRTVEANGHPQARTTLGRAYYYQGCPEQAFEQLNLAVQQGGNHKYIYEMNLAEALLFERPMDSYIRDLLTDALNGATAGMPEYPKDALRTIARAHAWLGHTDAAIEALNQLLDADPRSRIGAGTAAAVYEILGRRKEALQWLDQAFDRGLAVQELRHTPAFRNLRQSPELPALLKKHGLDLSVDPGDTIPESSQPCAQLGTASTGS